MANTPCRILDRAGLDRLLAALARRGWETLGPVERDRVIVYGPVTSTADLPRDWGDCHDGGHYRLYHRDDGALFGYVVGPGSPKNFLYPPHQRLYDLHRSNEGFEVEPAAESPRPLALIGVRACELAAIAVQDRVFLQGPYQDPNYRARRDNLFVVAVNCTEPGGTCFCVSQDTGPRATRGFDLALTEFRNGDHWLYAVDSGSARGGQVLDEAGGRPATDGESAAVEEALETARERMGRTLDNHRIKELLYRNLEHPRWAEVAERCLGCANCTLVCPTCFCSTVSDTSDLNGESATRVRQWDSCFNRDFTYIVGGSVRRTTAARYRQWLTHKLGSWHDQFGTSGCVGCGRCITWCPVGIDITAEARAIRQRDGEVAS